MHRAPHTDRALELALPTPDGATVLGPHELSMDVAREKCSLHENQYSELSVGAMFFLSFTCPSHPGTWYAIELSTAKAPRPLRGIT